MAQHNDCSVSVLPDGTEVPYMLCDEVTYIARTYRGMPETLRGLLALAKGEIEVSGLGYRARRKIVACLRANPGKGTPTQIRKILLATLVEQADGTITIVNPDTTDLTEGV